MVASLRLPNVQREFNAILMCDSREIVHSVITENLQSKQTYKEGKSIQLLLYYKFKGMSCFIHSLFWELKVIGQPTIVLYVENSLQRTEFDKRGKCFSANEVLQC